MEDTEQIFFDIHHDKFAFRHMRDRKTAADAFHIHTHDSPELIYMPEICGRQIIEDRTLTLHSGDLVLMPPAVHHGICFTKESCYERYVLTFDPCLLAPIDMDEIYRKVTVMRAAEHPVLPDIFGRADYYQKYLEKAAFEDLMPLLIKEIFYNLRLYQNAYQSESRSLNPVLSRAVEYISEHLFTIRSVSEVSDSLYITESYLFEIFKTQLKISPKKYITAKRLLTAKRELGRGASPTQIYQKVGFQNYSTFHRSYTAFFGYSPSQEKYAGFSGEQY